MWTADSDPITIAGIGVGIVALGYILFGILHHPAIAMVGLGFAASFYLPMHFAGDAAPRGVGSAHNHRSGRRMGVESQESRGMSEEQAILNETIHQSTRLRIMTLLVSRSDADRVSHGFIQNTLGLTGGNLTIHLRKLGGCRIRQTPPKSSLN